MNEALLARYNLISKRIADACARVGRDSTEVSLVAVSKKQPLQLMNDFEEICSATSSKVLFGENFVQEFKDKKSKLSPSSRTHLIGALQSNKSKDAVELFDLIESVHSYKILEALNKEAAKLGKKQEILLQVNISDDSQKHGFQASELAKVVEDLTNYPNIVCKGLMTITALYDEAEDARADFRKMSNLRAAIFSNPDMFELSMGMSQDFEIAIEEGATIVRVGTALFGARQY